MTIIQLISAINTVIQLPPGQPMPGQIVTKVRLVPGMFLVRLCQTLIGVMTLMVGVGVIFS